MRLLLDTHTFLWWLDGDRRLSVRGRRLIASRTSEVFVSAASAWEIAIKAAAGKLPGALDVAADISGCLESQGFRPLEITVAHAQRAGGLPPLHRDPFDRMLVAQAFVERLPVLSNDPAFDGYAINRIW
ncbi:MAG TPA: type II toxin-antitoxin system VapC family toxin [Thermoanaerobaculia bacterium]|nr:type II toxin-antitoxin system VapC family toxin [Thermoanaerobaculia bacterium]